MDKQTYFALRRIVEYLKEDERRHFEESNKPIDHIYRDVVSLESHLDEIAKDYD